MIASLLDQGQEAGGARHGWSRGSGCRKPTGVGNRRKVLDKKTTFKSGYINGHGTIASSRTWGYNSHRMVIKPYDSRIEELNTANRVISKQFQLIFWLTHLHKQLKLRVKLL